MFTARNLLILVAGASLAVACSKSDKEEPAPTKAAEAELPAFEGELTAEAINSATGTVQPFDPWTTGFAKLESKMGEPTLVEENRYYWGVMNGDSCTYIYVSKDNEAEFFKDKPDPQDMIGTVAKATTVSKDDAGNFAPCAKAAGVAVPDPEPETETDSETDSETETETDSETETETETETE